MKLSKKPAILMMILLAIAVLSLACGSDLTPIPVAPVSETLPQLPTTLPTPSPTPAISERPAATPTPSAPVESVSPIIASASLPSWLDRMLGELESQPPGNPPLTITRYEYKGQGVYFQTATCCDIFSNLYNEDDGLIAHPDGGITGRGDGRLPEFYQERERDFLVWMDAREPFGEDSSPVLAPLDGIELQIADSFPLQYFLTLVSGLPDGCHSFGGYTLTRDGNRVLIRVFNLRPSNTNLMCIQVYGTVDTKISLGSDFDPNETYTIDVNSKTISFRGDAILEETSKSHSNPS